MELEDGGEVLLWAVQCWLKPGATEQERSVCETLSFRHEEAGDRTVLLTWERPGSHPLPMGDVVTALEGSSSGMHRGAGSDYDIPTHHFSAIGSPYQGLALWGTPVLNGGGYSR